MEHSAKETRMVRLRRKAVTLARAGFSALAIGRMLAVSSRTVRRWKARFRKLGSTGLRTRPRPGRPSRLSPPQRRDLARRLVRGAIAHGFSTDLWTCPRIAKLIRRRYGVRYHVDHLPHLLKRLGFSVQRPERTARERDEKAIRTWIERDWPRLKKRPLAAAAPSFSSTKQAFS